MDPVQGTVQLRAAVGLKLFRQLLSLVKRDNDITTNVESTLEQRCQLRTLAGHLGPPNFGFDQVTYICSEWPEFLEIEFAALATPGWRIGFAQKRGRLNAVLS